MTRNSFNRYFLGLCLLAGCGGEAPLGPTQADTSLGRANGFVTEEGVVAFLGPMGLVDQMMDAWLAFARTGDPNHAGMPTWPAYNTTDRPTMLFDTTDTAPLSAVADDPEAAERSFWQGVPFDGIKPFSAPEDL